MTNLFTLIFLAAFLIPLLSCSISLKKPEDSQAALTTAHHAAYLFAINNPTAAVKLIKGPLPRFLDTLTEDTATQVFNTFSTTLLALTVKDPLLHTNFQAFLALIEVDLKGQHPGRSLFLVNLVLTHFLSGLKLGIQK